MRVEDFPLPLFFNSSSIDDFVVISLPITFTLSFLSHSILKVIFHSEYARNVLIANHNEVVVNSPRDCAK